MLSWVIRFALLLLFLFGKSTGQLLSCPPATVIDICDYQCNSDNECGGGSLKCCPTACGGTFCVLPVSARRNMNLVKPGFCPEVPKGPWVCANRCTNDGDCVGRAKCCQNRCGALACMLPGSFRGR
ncbi:antileukoproteinase-like [Lycorma delicatula]|uniref:antileukoproteinase-like n=1 Tax=Lycorma delicatula TaxID=130591 RepID=UPI003F50E688